MNGLIEKPEGIVEEKSAPFVELNRLHKAEADLALLKITDAANRAQRASAEIKCAQQDLKVAQEQHAIATQDSESTVRRILAEMKLDMSNVINVSEGRVDPPQGQELVVRLDD